MALEERETITDPKMLARSLVVLGMILVGFLLQRQTGLARRSSPWSAPGSCCCSHR